MLINKFVAGNEETPMPSVNDKHTKTVFYYNPVNVGYVRDL